MLIALTDQAFAPQAAAYRVLKLLQRSLPVNDRSDDDLVPLQSVDHSITVRHQLPYIVIIKFRNFSACSGKLLERFG